MSSYLNSKTILPVLAFLGLLFAVRTVIVGSVPKVPVLPVTDPATPPFPSYVSGSGMIEASTENISVSTNISGVVSDIFKRAGDEVKKDEPLFKVDDRSLNALLSVQTASLAVAEASLADSRDQLRIWTSVKDKRAVSEDDLSRRRYAVLVAEAKVSEAKAQLDSTKVELDRLIVKSPVDGTVLQVKIRIGEYAQEGDLGTPLMIVGSTKPLHVRVDVDENDSWRINEGAKAVAFLRGNPKIQSPLTYVRAEPYVIPKRALTGESVERVDTRVLQLIYRIDDSRLPIFVGQLVDVFIEAPPLRDPKS